VDGQVVPLSADSRSGGQRAVLAVDRAAAGEDYVARGRGGGRAAGAFVRVDPQVGLQPDGAVEADVVVAGLDGERARGRVERNPGRNHVVGSGPGANVDRSVREDAGYGAAAAGGRGVGPAEDHAGGRALDGELAQSLR